MTEPTPMTQSRSPDAQLKRHGQQTLHATSNQRQRNVASGLPLSKNGPRMPTDAEIGLERGAGRD